MVLQVIFIAAIVFSFLPGYFIYVYLFPGSDHPVDMKIAASYTLSFITIGFLQFGIFLGSGTPRLFLILYGVMCAALFAGLYSRPTWRDRRLIGAIFTFILFGLFCLTLTTLMPSYQAGHIVDWSHYFRNIFYYLNLFDLNRYTASTAHSMLFKRTPLYSLISASFQGLTGPAFYFHQAISVFLNSLIYWNVFTLTRKFSYENKETPLALLLLPLCPILVFGICIPTPKSFASFFLLTALAFYSRIREQAFNSRRRDDTTIFALSLGAAFMAHPAMLFYAVGFLADQIFLFMKKRVVIYGRTAVRVAVLAALPVLPWVVFVSARLGKEAFVPPSGITDVAAFSTGTYLWSRLTMVLASLFMPESLIALFSNGVDGGSIGAFFLQWGDSLLRFHWETWLGGFTLAGSIVFMWAALTKKELFFGRSYFWGALLTGAVISVLMNGVVDNQGQAANLMTPLTIALFCASCAAIRAMSSIAKTILALLMGCELALVVFTLYVLTATEPKIYPYLYSVEQFFSPRNSLAITIFLGAMLAGYGWRVSNPGKNIS